MKRDVKKIHHTLIATDTQANERLDKALTQLLPEYSRTQIKTWIEAGQVSVNGKPVKAKYKIKSGETILVNAPLPPPLTYEPEAIPLSIVFEDDALIIIDKPVGMVVHPGAGNKNQTLLNALLYHVPSLQNLPRAGIIHRIDKNTSGLLVIAKTPLALKQLTQQIKKRTLLREYQALVYGRLISGGKISAPIARHPIERKRMAIIEGGKPAITHYRVMEKYRSHTRLSLKLETGRTHQIRVHMASLHHPLIGDQIYGGRVRLAKGMTLQLIHGLRQFKRQALHAFALGLYHPVTNEWMRFESPLPQDLQQLIQLLQEDAANYAAKLKQ